MLPKASLTTTTSSFHLHLELFLRIGLDTTFASLFVLGANFLLIPVIVSWFVSMTSLSVFLIRFLPLCLFHHCYPHTDRRRLGF